MAAVSELPSLRPANVRTGSKCPICFEQILPTNVYFLECGHGYCKSCLFSWLSSRIKDREVKFECFSDALSSGGTLICKRPLSDSDVQIILGSTDMFQKWQRFRRMLADPTLRDCPFCGALQGGSVASPDMTCTQCTREFCYAHSNAHIGKTCQQYAQERGSQEALDEAFARRDTKPCPGCAAPTMKQEGCNSIRCVACHASWCWICGKIVDSSEMPTHFQWWNLGGCANKQFADGTENKIVSKIVTYAYFIFLGIPSFVLTAVMYVACSCACVPASLWYEQGPVAFFMTMTSMVSLALATLLLVGILGPIVLPFVILYGLAVAICMPCYIYGQRKRRAQEAGAAGTPNARLAVTAVPAGASSSSSTTGTGRSRTALMVRSPEDIGRPDTPRALPQQAQTEDLYDQGRDQIHPSEMYRYLRSIGQLPTSTSRRASGPGTEHVAVAVEEVVDPAPLDADPIPSRRPSTASTRSAARAARSSLHRGQTHAGSEPGLDQSSIIIDMEQAPDADPQAGDKALR